MSMHVIAHGTVVQMAVDAHGATTVPKNANGPGSQCAWMSVQLGARRNAVTTTKTINLHVNGCGCRCERIPMNMDDDLLLILLSFVSSPRQLADPRLPPRLPSATA